MSLATRVLLQALSPPDVEKASVRGHRLQNLLYITGLGHPVCDRIDQSLYGVERH